MKKTILLILLFYVITASYAQITTNTARLQQLSDSYFQKSQKQKAEALEFARINDIPIRIEIDSTLLELIYINERGKPQYYTTFNGIES